MNSLKPVIIYLILIIGFSSCIFFKKGSKDNATTAPKADKAVPKEDKAATAKPVDAKNMTEIVFGWGGGFTGMVEEYHLAKDGTLKLGDEIKKKLDNKQMKVINAAFKKVNFTKTKLNDPGNLYFFLAAKSKDNEQRLIWNEQTQLPPEVKTAYDELIKVTK